MKYLLPAIFLLLSPWAHANEVTGNELLAMCEAPKHTPLSELCESYIWVSSRGYDIAKVWSDQCLTWTTPEGVTPREIHWLVVEWMRDNPEMLDNDMELVIVSALKAAFPCPVSAVTTRQPGPGDDSTPGTDA